MEARSGSSVFPAERTTSWAEASLDTLTTLPGVRRAGIGLVEGGGRRLDFTSAERVGERPATWCEVDAYDDVPLNTAIRSGMTVAGSLRELEDSHPAFVQRQDRTDTQALAAVPIVADGRVLGAFVLFYKDAPTFADTVVRELVELGTRLGDALRETRPAALDETGRWVREPGPRALVVRFAVEGDPVAVAPARLLLRAALSGWDLGLDLVETAVLCLSELVTNAVVHGGSGCHVQVINDRGFLTVEVRSAGVDGELPDTDVRDSMRVHGRGLQLVDALTRHWGSAQHAGALSVWFVIEC